MATAWYKLLPEIVITKVQPCSPVHLWVTLPQQSLQLEACYEVAAALIRATALAQALHLQASMPALLQDLMSMARMRFDNAPCSVSAR